MGIIKAVTTAISGSLADQWLEVIESDSMGDQTVFTGGVKIRRGSNTKGTENTVSDGSVIHVYPNQLMMLVDGGKIIDYTAEEGYYTVKNSSLPSLFNGQFGEALKESFDRIRFGGETPTAQKVYFINLQEIKGIKFGTPNPVNYFDQFYNAELFLRAHGTYSIKVTDPLLFYAEAIPKNRARVEVSDINEQYLSEFLEALQTSINQMSADGIRISFVASKGRELGQYMADTLDSQWKTLRGMEIRSVGIASISYDEESKKLIGMRNQGAMLSDPSVREGYVQGAVARGMEAAGSNAGGSMAGFMGMGLGMNAGGGFMGSVSNANLQQMQMNQQAAGGQMAGSQNTGGQMAGGQAVGSQNAGGQNAGGQNAGGQNAGGQMAAGGQAAGSQNAGGQNPAGQPMGGQNASGQSFGAAGPIPGAGTPSFIQQAAQQTDGTWICDCGTVNTGKFCSECGTPRPAGPWTCECGTVNNGKFCSECGKPRQ